MDPENIYIYTAILSSNKVVTKVIPNAANVDIATSLGRAMYGGQSINVYKATVSSLTVMLLDAEREKNEAVFEAVRETYTQFIPARRKRAK